MNDVKTISTYISFTNTINNLKALGMKLLTISRLGWWGNDAFMAMNELNDEVEDKEPIYDELLIVFEELHEEIKITLQKNNL